MAIVTTDDKHYKDIATAIRTPIGATYKIKPEEMADRIGEVGQQLYYMGESTGYGVGYNEGKSDGITEGKQSEYDLFWDAFQQNGARTKYEHGFAGDGWNGKNFKPKYDIVVTNANYMFAYGSMNGEDLTEILKKSGVTMDTSQCTNFAYLCLYNSPWRVPVLDTRNASNLNYMFFNSSIRTIDKIILRDDGSQTYTNTFYIVPDLENIILEGVIGQNGFNVQWSIKLSHDSIVSIIGALSDVTLGLTVTLSKAAVNNAFETSAGAADGVNSDEWAALIATKPNWTISLI